MKSPPILLPTSRRISFTLFSGKRITVEAESTLLRTLLPQVIANLGVTIREYEWEFVWPERNRK